MGKVVDGLWIRHASGSWWGDPNIYFTMGYHVRGNGKAEDKIREQWEWVIGAASPNGGFSHEYEDVKMNTTMEKTSFFQTKAKNEPARSQTQTRFLMHFFETFFALTKLLIILYIKLFSKLVSLIGCQKMK